MNWVSRQQVQQWMGDAQDLRALTESIGHKRLDSSYLQDTLGLPLHLRYVIDALSAEGSEPLAPTTLASIPFYSLCRGLFLPLSAMTPELVAQRFGLVVGAPPTGRERDELLETFLARELGLTLVQKLGCVLGDPFRGRAATMRRDSLLRLLLSVSMVPRPQLLDRLTVVGDIALLFAENRRENRVAPALTAAEVLESVHLVPDLKLTEKVAVLRSVLQRCGKLEAYFLAKLILRRAGFGFDYRGPLLNRALAKAFSANEAQIAHAAALTDVFHVAQILAESGVEGLRKIQLQPLVPVRPALASGTTDGQQRFPTWVERKYDGIRLMLHKSTDHQGFVLCGAYTRSRSDWLELVPGVALTIKMLPAQTAIIDGELFGTRLTAEGPRPASVYDLFGYLQGDRSQPLSLKYAAFDLLYLNGADITGVSLAHRRQALQQLVAPLQGAPLPLPISLAEGQMANNAGDLNRLYQHFRAQGYEGIICKAFDAPYRMATRDPQWLKRKPAVTLDLVLTGAVFAVTEKARHHRFGSYVIAARTAEGGFQEIGDIAGVDRERDQALQAEIMREGLITGRRIERVSASGTRPGLELRPHIVVTVLFEGLVKDAVSKTISLRGPRFATIRSDKSAFEADTVDTLEQLYLKQRVG